MPEPTPASQRLECRRCGRFAPALDADEVCEDCVQRLTELERVPPTLGNVLLAAVVLPIRIGWPALLLVAVAAAPTILIRHLDMYVPFVGYAVDVLAQGALLILAHRHIQGRRVALATAGQAALDRAVRLVVVAFFAHFQIGLLFAAPFFAASFLTVAAPDLGWLFLLLALLVGLGLAVYRAATLALAMPIAAHEDKEGLGALSESTRRTRGHRAPAFVFALVGLLWLLIPLALDTSLFLFSVGIQAVGVFNPQVATEYATRLEAIGPPIEVAGGLLTAAAMLFMTSVSAVLYAKTVRYRIY